MTPPTFSLSITGNAQGLGTTLSGESKLRI